MLTEPDAVLDPGFATGLASAPAPAIVDGSAARALRTDPRDPIAAAVDRGVRAGRGWSEAEGHVLVRASRIAAGARKGGESLAALDTVLGLVRAHPGCERLQVLAARLVEAAETPAPGSTDREAAAARAWEGVAERFPSSLEAFRLMLRWTMRRRGREAARRALLARFTVRPEVPADLLLYAWGHDELRCYPQADAAFAHLVARAPRESHVLQFARCLTKRGALWAACRVLEAGAARPGASRKLVELRDAARADCARLEAFAPGGEAGNGYASCAAIEEVFARLAPTRRTTRSRRRVGRVMMITGSLGAGGAERQFAVTARALSAAAARRDAIAGHPVAGPVEIVCRSLGSRPGGDFFAPQLREAGVPIREYAGLAPFAGRACAGSVLAPFEPALAYLPPAILEGTTRLADAIRAARPHVVHIWQDGSILAGGLAALAAGVPRIVLNVRSLPPIDRPDRDRPEYEGIFRGLLAAPGVRLTANSHAAARRYAAWLSLDPARVGVIYNGVDALPRTGAPADLAKAALFEARAGRGDFTVGTVMRLDGNKRPFLWLDAAARILARAPRTRFVVVGDGPLREDCVLYAARLGLADRVVFVGCTERVGYWLDRMDAFVLLSLVEGLPNVLIEAQHAGVPVVTTDVGGAAETIDAGRTGLLLPPGEDLDPEAVAACVLRLRDEPGLRRAMSAAARDWAQRTFSVSAMMERTVRTFME